MSRSQFLAYFLLGSLLTTRGRADRIVVKTIKDNDLRQDCAFELDGYGYNLCPLVDKRSLVEVDGARKSYDEDKGEGSSSGGRFYEVALGGLDVSSYSTRVSSGLEVRTSPPTRSSSLFRPRSLLSRAQGVIGILGFAYWVSRLSVLGNSRLFLERSYL